MGSADNGAQALSELVRLASTLMVQGGMEAEQADFVGRTTNAVRARATATGINRVIWTLRRDDSGWICPRSAKPGNPFTRSCSNCSRAIRRCSSSWPRRCMPEACRPATSRPPSPTNTVSACCRAPASARSPRRCGRNMRPSKDGLCGTFRCCMCSSTASTDPCACMGSGKKRCCAPGRLLPRGQGAVVVGSGQLGDFDVWLSFLRDLVSRGLPAPLTRCGPTAGAYAAEYIICAICATSNQRYPIISCPGSRRI